MGKLKENIRNRAQNILLFVLLIMVLIMLYEVEKFSNACRLMNCAGAARAGAQRYVKLEIFGIHNQELIDKYNKILDGLWNGSEELKLPRINDENFRKNLEIQRKQWTNLYNLVEDMEHSYGKKKISLRTKVLIESENYFKLTDNTVNAAEAYADKLADYLSVLELILGGIVISIMSLMIIDYTDKKNLLEQNIRLRKKAYIDVHTGLPNKSSCEAIFNDNKAVTDDICIVMFDLNGLKSTNDNQGHIAGDELIKGFADILKTSVRDKDFVGRYGGDEFVGVIYHPESDELTKIFSKIKYNVKKFNEENPNLNLSYAYGCSYSKGRNSCTMKQLLSEADEGMYKNKISMKKNMDYYDYVL